MLYNQTCNQIRLIRRKILYGVSAKISTLKFKPLVLTLQENIRFVTIILLQNVMVVNFMFIIYYLTVINNYIVLNGTF
jgi:hypothetical protein